MEYIHYRLDRAGINYEDIRRGNFLVNELESYVTQCAQPFEIALRWAKKPRMKNVRLRVIPGPRFGIARHLLAMKATTWPCRIILL